MGTPTRQSRLGEKVDSKTMVRSKKMLSSPMSKHLNLGNSPSTPSCRPSLRKRREHPENVENAKSKSSSNKGEDASKLLSLDASDGSAVRSSCKSLLLLEPRVGRTRSSQNLIPCMDFLPVIEEKSRLLRKSPRTSISKPKLSPRKDHMSSLRPSSPPPPPPRHLRTTSGDANNDNHGEIFEEKRLRKSPRRPSITKPELSPKKGPISPILPPRTLRAITDASYFNDFSALTPIILYGEDKGRGEHIHTHYPHPPQSAPMSNQYYHQSPHWSGQVRVNPFSPVPEQYLRPPPPTSVKSVTRESRKRQHHSSFYGGHTNINNNGNDVETTTNEMIPPPQAKKTRFYNPILPQCAEVPDITSILPLFDNIDTSQQELDLINREISPTDVMTQPMMINTGYDTRSKPPPQSMDSETTWENGKSNGNSNNKNNNYNNRTQIKRGRYLDDFQEVKFLGAGSFGSVYACLSRLDGCMYAVKAISPSGRSSTKDNDRIAGYGQDGGSTEQYLYGKCPSSVSSAPRRDLPPSPLRRKKTFSRLGIGLDNSIADDNCYIEGMEGSRHWNDAALRRVLREVFALAALCQQDDFRTFHIVRYQQAWLEEDGTLYIQTELCTATLRDEMSGSVKIMDDVLQTVGDVISGGQRINVFRQLKILREVLLALELVHQQGMVHLDIKPENIFVKNNLYKLGDFGLANAFTANGRNTSVVDIEEGDSRYMSKDLLDSSPKDLTKCDIFSLGATMYEVCSRQSLPSCGQNWQDLRNGKVPSLPGILPSLNIIIKDMMHPDPDKRPSATDLLSRDTLHEYYNSNPLRQESASYKVGPQVQSKAQPLTRSASWTM